MNGIHPFKLLGNICCLLLITVTTATADDLRETSVIGQIPDDASFLFVTREHKTIFNRVMATPLLQRWTQQSEFQKAWSELTGKNFTPNENTDETTIWWNTTEEGQLVRDFAFDALSHEFFIYGDNSWVEMPRAFAGIFKRLTKLDADIKQGEEELGDDQQAKRTLAMLKSIPDEEYAKIQIPNTTFGVWVEDVERAQQVLELLRSRLESQLQEADANFLRGIYTGPQQGDQVSGVPSYYSFNFELRGDLLPTAYLQAMFDQSELTRAQEELVYFFIDGLRSRSLTVSVGRRGHLVLFSIGGDPSKLYEQPTGDRLVDHKKFEVLQPFLERTITSLSYISDDLMRLGWTEKRSTSFYDDWAKSIREDAKDDEGIQKIVAEQLADDLVELGRDLQQFHTRPGGKLGFSVLNESSFEAYRYDWSQHPQRDASRPLEILNHVGGKPFFVHAWRKSYRPEVYNFRSKWLARVWWYLDKAAIELGKQTDGAEMLMYAMFKEQLRSYAKEFDELNRELLIPAFEDGQGAFVLDLVDTTSKPRSYLTEDFPTYPYLPRAALVFGISDRDKFLEATDGFRRMYNRFANMMASLSDDSAAEKPPIIDLPQRRDVEGGTVYWLRNNNADPDNASSQELDAVPVASVSESIVAVTTDWPLAQKILVSTPFEAPQLEFETDRPLYSLTHVNLEILWNALSEPFKRDIQRRLDENEIDKEDAIGEQLVWDLLSHLRTINTTTDFEDDKWVTHTKVVIGPGPSISE